MLHLEVLVRRFDHDVAVGEIGKCRRQAEPRDRGIAPVRRQRSLLDLARQKVCDLVARLLGPAEVDLTTDRVEAGFDCKLRDPRAHRAQADDPDLHRRSTTPAIAMPKPTHIDAMP